MTKRKITDLLDNVREHVVMRDFTSLRVGGVADYFFEASSVDDLVKAVRKAVEINLPYFILGGGSNILFSDYGFPGLVIKNSTSNIAIMREKSQVIVDSGVYLSKLIMACVANDLSGIEFLYGIPGTIGGSVYGNAGAYGQSVGDYIKNITMLIIDPKDGVPKIVQYNSSWMEFGYRTSKLKKMKNRFKPVILSCKMQLSQNQKEEIMRRINKSKDNRVKSQPIGSSAGCVFQNPIPKELENVIGRGSKGMPELPIERRAGYMLDQAGAKNLKIGSAEVSNKHANFVINTNSAKASEIRMLIEEMREKVREKYNIVLNEEIEYIGQW